MDNKQADVYPTAGKTQGGYALVNGLKMYYEVHGKGMPLIVLHGGLSVISLYDRLISQLAQSRQVIGMELQAHGHTADIDRPLSFEAMADDVANLAQQLGLARIDIAGYSLGGGIAWQTAIRHPELIRKLVVVSAPVKRNGWYPEVLAGMAAINAELARTWVGSPMQTAYASVAPKPEDWPVLAEKTSQLLKRDYDWSKEVASIRAPVLIAVGDADSVRTAHAVEIFELLGGGKQDAGWEGSGIPNARLAILPGTTHYAIFNSPELVSAMIAFLDAPMPDMTKTAKS